MKKLEPKKARVVNIPPQTLKKTSKPSKTGLSKKDPLYYAKIGVISAAKRKLTAEFFSGIARLSHGPDSRPDGYRGGRPKKDSK